MIVELEETVRLEFLFDNHQGWFSKDEDIAKRDKQKSAKELEINRIFENDAFTWLKERSEIKCDYCRTQTIVFTKVGKKE